jgi:hypothetical protein
MRQSPSFGTDGPVTAHKAHEAPITCSATSLRPDRLRPPARAPANGSTPSTTSARTSPWQGASAGSRGQRHAISAPRGRGGPAASGLVRRPGPRHTRLPHSPGLFPSAPRAGPAYRVLVGERAARQVRGGPASWPDRCEPGAAHLDPPSQHHPSIMCDLLPLSIYHRGVPEVVRRRAPARSSRVRES